MVKDGRCPHPIGMIVLQINKRCRPKGRQRRGSTQIQRKDTLFDILNADKRAVISYRGLTGAFLRASAKTAFSIRCPLW